MLTIRRDGWWIRGPGGREIATPEAPDGRDGLIALTREFLRFVQAREEPRSGIASMSRTTVACHPINTAYLAGEPVRWSEERNDIEGDAGKDTSSYRRKYRGPRELPEYA